jgi:hypothetical protein
MPDDDDGEFAVGPGSELQERFGWTAENWTPPILRNEAVPESLRDLLPVARRWGVTCDVTRHAVAAKATDAELSELAAALCGRHQQIEDWLYSPADGQSEVERSAFQAMVVLELEACDGPGLAGLLAWAVRWYKDAPSPVRLKRLREAYAEVLGWGAMPHLADDLRKARELIETVGEPRGPTRS